MIGQRISHYLIQEELGRGGMGVVYRAFDERLQRAVALKVLSGGAAATTGEGRSRLLAEARAASALNHPAITTVYEIGEDGEQVFIAMELVTGRTLRSLAAEGRMEPMAVVRMASQLAAALAVAHERGVIHGDIKPANVIVQSDGRVKLFDFGIARHVAAEALEVTTTQTQLWTGSGSGLTGTLAYMAPEQWRGEKIDARSDLFSLGVLMYELLAGRRPFPGPNAAALMAQVLHGHPPPLETLAPVPPALSGVVQRLLDPERANRYGAAQDLVADLDRIARDMEVGMVLPASAPRRRSIAVLPFQLLTPSAEDQYLGVALADAVANRLSSCAEMTVRPVSSSAPAAVVDPVAAGRELNAYYVVSGTIQKVGQQVRVHAQAWDVSQGTALLSTKADGEVSRLFALQDEVAGQVARALGVATHSVRAAPSTANPLAYELYLRGIERLMRMNRWDVRTAIEMLEEALKLDRRFVEAWASIAEAYLRMALVFEPKGEWMRKANAAARKALSLDPGNPDAQAALGHVLWTPAKRFQHAAALRAIAAALRTQPGNMIALTRQGTIFNHIGLHDQARLSLGSALAANPDESNLLDTVAQTAFYEGRYDEADQHLTHALQVDPASFYPNVDLPAVAIYRGHFDRAAEKIRSARLVAPKESLLDATEGLLLAHRGEKRKAEQALQRATRGGHTFLHTHHVLHIAAAGWAVLGKAPQAIALLKKAAATGLPNYPLFSSDPHFQLLQDDPAWRAFMSGLKRQWQAYKREFGGT